MAELKTSAARDPKGRFTSPSESIPGTNVPKPNLGSMMAAMAATGDAASGIANAASQARPQPAAQPAPQQSQPQPQAPTQTDAPPVSSPSASEPQTQPQQQPASPAESVQDEGRIPYDRFKEVNDKLNAELAAKKAMDEQILSMRKELAEKSRELELQKLRSTTPPPDFENMSEWERAQWTMEQILKFQSVQSETDNQPASPTSEPKQQSTQSNPEFDKFMLERKLGLTSPKQADLVYDIQQSHPSLSPMDALALAKAQSPESFTSAAANGTVPPANFNSALPPSAPSTERAGGPETSEQQFAKTFEAAQQAAVSGNRMAAQAEAIKAFGILRQQSGSHQLQNLQRAMPPQQQGGGQGQPQ